MSGVRVCPQPGCPNFRPCQLPGHEPEPWAGSNRKARLPGNWQKIRRRVLRRDPTCRWPDCDQPAVEVDHIDDPDNHNLDALQGLCHQHHLIKTLDEARAARERNTTG